MRDDLSRGEAWDTTLAYSILRDLLRLPAETA